MTPRTFAMPAGDHLYGPFRVLQKAPRLIPIGQDALAKIKATSTSKGAKTLVTLTEGVGSGSPDRSLGGKCNTNSAVGFAPSDIHGASSSTRLVVVTNVEVGVYTTKCTLVSKVSLKTFFGAPAEETLFDPRVIYDRLSSRFFITAESRETAPSTDQRQYFAVSTSFLASAWTTYGIKLSEASTSTLFCKAAQNSFWDYPSAGVNGKRLFITSNDFGASVVGALLDIDKAPLLSGGVATARCFSGLPFNLAPPVVLDASDNAVFLSPGSGAGDVIARRDLFTSASGLASDTLTVMPSFFIAAWSAAPDAPQPNGEVLDTLDGRFQSFSTQSRGILWNIHTVGIGATPAAKIRWYRMNATSKASFVLNTATFQTSAADRLFNPSIITTSGLTGAPTYISVSRTVPSITTGAGRVAQIAMWGLNNDRTAANWTFGVVETSTAEFTGCPCRWGDYSSVTPDPNNDGTAWGFNQLVTGPSQFNWKTVAGKMYLTLPAGPTP